MFIHVYACVCLCKGVCVCVCSFALAPPTCMSMSRTQIIPLSFTAATAALLPTGKGKEGGGVQPHRGEWGGVGGSQCAAHLVPYMLPENCACSMKSPLLILCSM